MTEDELLLKRRGEGFIRENIGEDITLKRTELKRQRKKKRKIRYSKQDYNFLQYNHLIRKWVYRNYDITPSELDMLFYMYPIVVFTRTQFTDFQKDFGAFTYSMFNNLIKKKLIVLYSNVKRKKYYVISNKGNTLIGRIHKMYMLEEPIPMSACKNAIARTVNEKDKRLMDLFKVFNDKVKENIN